MNRHSTRPDQWTVPRPYSDPNLRRQTYGKIIPMNKAPLWKRLFLGAE
jgi:hypothetical protein